MATNTYVALDKITVGSAVASVTFSSIPSGYTDLVIVGNFGTTSGGANIALQVGNGSIDTGSNYSFTYLRGDGSSAASGRASSQAQIYIDYSAYATTSISSTYIWQVQNYSNTTTYKTVLGRANTASVGTNATAGLWRSTSAINTIKLDTQSTTFLSGSTFSLYGIAVDANAYTAKATGGTITADVGYVYHTFTSSGTFTPTENLTVDYLVVAGGGGGGANGYGGTGGGGAGGYRSVTGASVTANTGITATIGAGGTASLGWPQTPTNGVDSSFNSITSIGGGYGGYPTGASGGSGGGGGGGFTYGTGGAGTSGQGYAGGNSYSSGGGGGGGGAGAIGSNGYSASGGGDGGAGALWLNGQYYAGGGGGGGEYPG